MDKKPISPPGGNGRRPELPTQDVKTEYLSLIDIFRDLPREEIKRLAAELPMRTYSAGAVIYAPGEPSDVLFLLKRGCVNIVQQVAGGKRLVTSVLQPHTFFGEMALAGERLPEWVCAQAADDVLVCLLDRAFMERLVLAHPRIGLRLAERLAARLAEAESALASFAYAPIVARLARALVHLAEHDPDQLVHASHDHLAALVGTCRETVTTNLRSLQRDGIVELHRRSIRIADMDRLQRLAASWPHRS